MPAVHRLLPKSNVFAAVINRAFAGVENPPCMFTGRDRELNELKLPARAPERFESQENNVVFFIGAGPCRPGIAGATRPGSDFSRDILFPTFSKQP